MYLAYVDESGHAKAGPGKGDDRYYILSGVIVHEDDWKAIEDGMGDVKRRIFPLRDPQNWELHASDIWQKGDRSRSGKRLQLSLEKKNEMFSRVLEFVSESRVTLLCVVIRKDELKYKYYTQDVLRHSWTFLAERFEHFLSKKAVGSNKGMFLVDSSEKNIESKIRDIVADLTKKGSDHQRVDHVIEEPIFVKSHLRNMIQMADMVGYVVHRHYKEDPRFKDWFEVIKPSMYSPGGGLQGFGIKHFPRHYV